MPSRTKTRTVRKYDANAYIRIAQYLSEDDQALVICWYSAVHATYVTEVAPGLLDSLIDLLARALNLTGIGKDLIEVAAKELFTLRRNDVLECDRRLTP